MSLYRSISGAGPDVALLHGWGLHGGVFASLATALASTHRVHVLDLPGHGYSPWSKSAGDLEGWARLTAAHLPARCAVIGWSLRCQRTIGIYVREWYCFLRFVRGPTNSWGIQKSRADAQALRFPYGLFNLGQCHVMHRRSFYPLAAPALAAA